MESAQVVGLEHWNDFFILIGTGSATLAGLVFVAMTINFRGAVTDATHRFRAINMLSGFTAVFIISSLALMGDQSHRAVGIEWLIVSVLATVINTNGYVQAFRQGSSRFALSPFRIVGGSLCYLGQVVGSILLILGFPAGIYLAAVALVINFIFFVSGAWLLIIGPSRTPD